MKEALPRSLFHRKFKVIIIQKSIIIFKIFKMKKYIFLFFMLVGSVLISCEKDDDHKHNSGEDVCEICNSDCCDQVGTENCCCFGIE